MARLLALDVGEVRIGVAVSDATGILASPYATLRASRDERQTWQEIQRMIEETGAEGIIVGLPISLDGQIHAQGQRVQAFAERLSTVEAERLLAQRSQDEGGKRQRRTGRHRTQARRRKPGHEIDALAAAVILQEYLDHLGSTKKETNI
jgi:putative Holliday junction resolvase